MLLLSLLGLLVVLNIADGVTTYIALKNPALEEKNPLLKFLMAKIGIVPTIVSAKVALPVLVYLFGMNLVLLLVVNGIYVVIVGNNIIQIRRGSKSEIS